MPVDALALRQLNRVTLARQLLLARAALVGREIVLGTMMRATLHVTSAADFPDGTSPRRRACCPSSTAPCSPIRTAEAEALLRFLDDGATEPRVAFAQR